jgi:TPR repeat protein
MTAWLKARTATLEGSTLPPELLPRVLELAGQDYPYAHLLAAAHFEEAGDDANARRWLERGAATGETNLMEQLATAQIWGDPGPRNREAGIALMRRAADTDAWAMDWMGDDALAKQQWLEAESWYSSAVQYGKESSLVDWLELHWQAHPGISFTPAQVGERYRELEGSESDSAALRRSHARYLLEVATPRDPAKAAQLLRKDAEAGDAASQYQLGIGMIEGRFGKPELAAGKAWVQKAADKDMDYGDSWAYWLYYSGRDAASRRQAFDIERGLAGRQHSGARNNLAWWLCTSEDAQLRAPAEAMQLVASMGALETLDPGTLDTVAACYAASGDFERAAQVQLRVIELAPSAPGVFQPGEMEARLALYRGGKAYVEPPDAKTP